ncbi:MAG TPA: EAL domain-containing protein, partial [Thermoanaerobaculia bacterium]|nr:EAL domain-containing protein [Thermoanaerobaculia bacterium]
LTGWDREAAAGRPVGEVFQLFDETGGDIASLLARCIADGSGLRLAERITLNRRDGRRYAVESTCAPIHDAAGETLGTVIVFQDVSDKRLLSLQLAHQATHDELTGLLNRQAFSGHLQRLIEECRREDTTHTLCYMDLDQFKLVNETCGHLAGDELLRRVTALLQEALRPEDVVARLGGDEFGVLLPRCPLPEAERRIGAFHRTLKRLPYLWQEKSFAVGASIGLVPVTRAFQTVAQLLSAADHACYLAKEKGRNRIQVYQEDDAEFVRRNDEMNWVVRIHQTLRENRFRLFSQEIRPLSERAGQGLYFEVLLRMVEDDGRIHLPSDFIRAAERYGLMRSIDRWVVRHCAETLAAQPRSFLDGLDTCAINLSAVSLGDDEFLGYVLEQFERFPVPPQKICFEITETAAIENLPQAARLLQTLSGFGFRFALDDFGTGMSSFSYLKEIPVSILKIDGKFTKDVTTDDLDRAMVESINQVGHVLGLRTVAEGVGSRAVEERLRILGVDFAQGNWVSPPGPLEGVCAVAVGNGRDKTSTLF